MFGLRHKDFGAIIDTLGPEIRGVGQNTHVAILDGALSDMRSAHTPLRGPQKGDETVSGRHRNQMRACAAQNCTTYCFNLVGVPRTRITLH